MKVGLSIINGFGILLLWSQAFANNTPPSSTLSENSVKKVLFNLYEANGNKTLFMPPEIEITDYQKRVAAYFPRQHKIIIERKALEVCSTFGQDSLSALAFIIGHELTHAYQKNHHDLGEQSDYLGFHKSINVEIKIEKEADIHGLFNAYVAGYKAIDLLPTLMVRLYTAYDLINVSQTGYPSLEERKMIALEVQTEVQKLIHLYDGANYLAAIGQQDLAAACLHYIAQFYQGREVYNNMAVNLALHAINFTEKDVDILLYPLELDWDARIKKPKITRGPAALTPQEINYRRQQLQQAEVYLDKINALAPHHFSTQINLLCIWNLLEKYDQTIQYYQQKLRFQNTTSKEKALAELALAIAYAKKETVNSLPLARKIWVKLKNHPDKLISYQADYNLKMLSYEKCDPVIKYQCWDMLKNDDFVDGIRLHRMTYQSGFALTSSVNVQLQKTSNSLVYTFQKGRQLFRLQRILQKSATKIAQLPPINTTSLPLQLVATDTGNFLICTERKIIWQADQYGKVTEWAKWW